MQIVIRRIELILGKRGAHFILSLWLTAALIFTTILLPNEASIVYADSASLRVNSPLALGHESMPANQPTSTLAGQALLFGAATAQPSGSQATGVANVTVTAYDASGAVAGSAITTGANGDYAMDVTGSPPIALNLAIGLPDLHQA